MAWCSVKAQGQLYFTLLYFTTTTTTTTTTEVQIQSTLNFSDITFQFYTVAIL
jgi:hypothetical protein